MMLKLEICGEAEIRAWWPDGSFEELVSVGLDLRFRLVWCATFLNLLWERRHYSILG